MRARVVLAPADVPHAAHGPGPTLGFCLDAERCARVTAFARGVGRPFALEEKMARDVIDAIVAHRASLTHADVLSGLAREVTATIGRDATPPSIDARITNALEILRDPQLDARATIDATRLSTQHFRALFVRDVGTTPRTYRLWRRLLAAIEGMRRVDATRAAHDAGFADLAHFSRTCRRMLGHSPTGLRNGLMR